LDTGLIASSFYPVAITASVSLAGRKLLIPLSGHDAFSTFAIAGKWVHKQTSHEAFYCWGWSSSVVSSFVDPSPQPCRDRTDI